MLFIKLAHKMAPREMIVSSSGQIQSLGIEGLEHNEDDETWIDDGDDSEDDRKPAASTTLVARQQDSGSPAPVMAVEVQEEDMDPHSMATSAVAFIRPHTLHPLQLNALEGTSLENTFVCNLRGIRHWLNVTKLYNPMFAVMARWLYGSAGRQVDWNPVASSETSWLR